MTERHLVVFSPQLPPSSLGVAQRMGSFIDGLEDAGYHLKIITGRTSHLGQSLLFDLPITTKNFYVRSLREILSGIELGVRITLAKDPCLFISTPPFLTAVIAAWFAHLSKKYFVLDVRDELPDVFLKQGRIRKNSFLDKTVTQFSHWLFEHAVIVFTATQTTKDKILARHPALVDRTFVVWNGYDSELYKPSEEKLPKFSCILHGNTGLLQDIPLARNVAAELKKLGSSVEILVCGPGPQSALVKGAGLENFKYMGPLQGQEAAALVAKCHLGLAFRANHLTGDQSFSQTVFDCLGAGLPMISSPKNEAGLFLQYHNCGRTFDEKDAAKIAETVAEISTNKDLYTSLCGNVGKIRESMSRQKLRSILVEVLNQL